MNPNKPIKLNLFIAGIARTMGKDRFYKLHPKVKKIVIEEEAKKFKQEMIQQFGSYANYTKHWLKNNLYIKKGFSGKNEYRRFLRFSKNSIMPFDIEKKLNLMREKEKLKNDKTPKKL